MCFSIVFTCIHCIHYKICKATLGGLKLSPCRSVLKKNTNADEPRKFLIFKSAMESPQRFQLRQREASWQLFSAYPASSQDLAAGAAFVRLRGDSDHLWLDSFKPFFQSSYICANNQRSPKAKASNPNYKKKYVGNIPIRITRIITYRCSI